MQTESRLPANNIKLTSEIETRLKNKTYETNPNLYKDDLRKVNTRLTHFKEAYKKSQRRNTATKISELEQVLQKLRALSPVFAAPAAAPAAAAKAPAPAAAPAAAAIPAAKAPAAAAKAPAAPAPAAKAPVALPLKPVSERTQTPYPNSPSKTIEALRTAKAEAEAEAEEAAKEEEEDVIVVNNSQEAYVEINHKCPADSNESFKLGGDELADGNCFYSSLYRAALHHINSEPALVSKIFNIFGGVGKPTDEKAFITQLRTQVGDLLIQGIDSEKKQKYLKNIDKRPDILTNAGREEQREQTRTFFETLLNSAFEGHGAQLQTWVEEAPDQIKAFFNIKNIKKSINTQELITYFLSKYNNESDSQRFYTDMASFIKTDRVYSSQLDIEVIKYVLEKNKILLEIVSDKTSKKCMFLSGMPALWLYRRIGSAHYGYFRKSLEAKARTTAAPAAVKAAEKPCQKLYDPCTKKEITGPNAHQTLLARVLELNDAKTSGTVSGTRKRKLRKSRKTRKH